MSLSYDPLWKLLNKLKISKMDFAQRIDISNATLAKLGKNEPVTLTIIEKICNEFHCNIDDVVIHIAEEPENIPAESLKVGVIVDCLCYPLNTSTKYRLESIRHNSGTPQNCVILKVGTRITYYYIIAPIIYSSEPEFILDIPISNIHIFDNDYQGYIQLSKLGIIDLRHIKKIVGKISISEIETKVINVFDDLIPLLIKYTPVHEALLYNVGLTNK